ncbi:hypothetical protein ACGFNP_42995 [Nonomuraea sp. NPDC049269]|uniref:hypothetical protein n=1 Tax=Nonomuraea sp. NPDC049269 TaxID=3364349 RepID=UPI00371FF239
MSLNPPASGDRGYAVIWATEFGYDIGDEAAPDIADSVHRVIGLAVRLCWRGDHDIEDYRGHEDDVRQVAVALSQVAKVALSRDKDAWGGGERITWELWFRQSEHVLVSEHDYLVSQVLTNAAGRLWPNRHHHADYFAFNNAMIRKLNEPEDVSLDWHLRFAEFLQAQGGNQARIPRVKQQALGSGAPSLPSEDNLIFTNIGELKLYRALKQRQQKYDQLETIGIFPLPGMHIPGHTFEPDVLVTLKGRAGVIEIDGPHHIKRWAFDKSKDYLLENAGVALISRIGPEDIDNPKELEAFLDRFLRKLGGE